MRPRGSKKKKKMAGWKRFLCLFAQEHPDFRLQELHSLAAIAQCELRYEPSEYSNKNPLLVVQLQSELCARKIMSRTLLIRSIFELWGCGADYDDLERSINEAVKPEQMEPYTRSDYTFKLFATGFSRKCTADRQREIFQRLSFLPFRGQVELSKPDHKFHILEDYGDNPNSAPLLPVRIFFGRLIAEGQRNLISHFSLKTRHFIGNTSMDAQLSLIMANQAQVKPGSLVYDPFAGTGSLLVACAHFGGYVLGSDIDHVLLHGRGYTSRAKVEQKYRGRDENVRANLRQYNLEHRYLDILVADAAVCVWRRQEIFDAIVTDPPYGVREGARKIGSKKDTHPVPAEFVEEHIPAVRSYKLSDVFNDLLEFAAAFLVVGGRLVYWLPQVSSHTSLPSHPRLKLVACSEQKLQKNIARKLVTMEKTAAVAAGSVVEDAQLPLDLAPLRSSGSSSSSFERFREKYFSDAKTKSSQTWDSR